MTNNTPTPPAPADDKCWKCGGGVERTNTTLPGCDNDIFHDGQPPALPTEGAHPNGPVEGCPCHLCRYAFGEDSPADDAPPPASGEVVVYRPASWKGQAPDDAKGRDDVKWVCRRAADASGAEAMREACVKACRDRSRSLYDGKQMAAGLEASKCADMIDALPLPARDDAVEEAAVREAFVAHMATVGVTDVAWTNALGPVGTRADHYGVMLSVEWERFAAGYRAALPARDDAVEEAAKRAYIVHGRALSPFPTYDHGAEWDRRRQYDGDRVVALWMDIARAALRREKGGA